MEGQYIDNLLDMNREEAIRSPLFTSKSNPHMTPHTIIRPFMSHRNILENMRSKGINGKNDTLMDYLFPMVNTKRDLEDKMCVAGSQGEIYDRYSMERRKSNTIGEFPTQNVDTAHKINTLDNMPKQIEGEMISPNNCPSGNELDSFGGLRPESQICNMQESIMDYDGDKKKENNLLPLSPRERWKKAIRKVIFMNKFNNLNKELKVEKTLFGRSKASNNIKNNIQKLQCIILPSSIFKLIWSIVMVLALIFTMIYVPIRIAFFDKVSLTFFILEYIVDLIFISDIIFNFFTAYYDQDHILITNKKLIAKAYFKGWFIIDVLACIPVNLFDTNNDENGRGNVTSLLRLLRLGRLYRIVKIFRLVKVLKVIKGSKIYERFLIAMKMNAGIKRLIKAILIFFVFMHLFGCAWFYQAKFFNFEPESWVVRYGVRDLSPGYQYLISFYWVTTLSTIGYGDIIPYTKNERILAIIFMMIGVGFVTYAISSLSSIMLTRDSRTQILKKKFLALEELSQHLDLDPNLYYQIKRIIRNNHETHFYSEMNHETLMEELPSSLRLQLLSLIFKKNNLGAISFFHRKSPYFINDILPLLKRITLEKNEVIYHYGDYIDESTVKLVSQDHYVFSTYNEGSYFGESDILNKNNFRSESAISTEKCELITLQKSDLLKLFETHTATEGEMNNIMNKRKIRHKETLYEAKKINEKLDDNIIQRLSSVNSSIFNKECLVEEPVKRMNSGFKPTYEFPRRNSSYSDKDNSLNNSYLNSKKKSKSSTICFPIDLLNKKIPSKNSSGTNIVEDDNNQRIKLNNTFSSYREATHMSEEVKEYESKQPELYDFKPNQCNLNSSPRNSQLISRSQKQGLKRKNSKPKRTMSAANINNEIILNLLNQESETLGYNIHTNRRKKTILDMSTHYEDLKTTTDPKTNIIFKELRKIHERIDHMDRNMKALEYLIKNIDKILPTERIIFPLNN